MGDRNKMRKNDKLVVSLGVVILIAASIGIYFWNPGETVAETVKIEEVFSVSSVYSGEPDAVTVSDNCSFYALIATPLTVHYDNNGLQYVKPLYVKNSDEVSQAIIRVEEQIGIQVDEIIDETKTAKETSLYIANKYWVSSDAVLLIEDNETGYNLGVVATPMASYLGIPVIVTNEVDQDVRAVLSDLGVKYSLVCGDIEGYGKSIKFNDADEIVNASIELVRERFGDVEYITIANPRDAWPPEVLDETQLYFDGTLKSGSLFPSQFFDAMKQEKKIITFSIPEDYKYALVNVDFKNLEEPENIEKFGDSVVLQGSLIGFARTGASPSERDVNGNVECDRFHYETVLYDMGGEEFDIKLVASFHTLDQADYELYITIEKLSDPYYPLMNQLSSNAPYLAAFHKGIVYAKPEFAFAADDDVILDGKTLTGNTQVMKNPILIPVLNRHVYENIHEPLNELLAKLKDIDISDDAGKESLTKACRIDPFYIALIGDTTMIPQYYYRSPHNDPFDHQDKMYGTGCPSDFIYGNIDPETYFMQPHIGKEDTENDLYSTSDYPEVENIVGRITGWDVQDASALIARTVFYENIIEKMGDWKDNAVVMSGAGLEFQKLPIFNTIYNILGQHEPMKFPTGEQHFLNMRTSGNLEEGEFNVEVAERGQAQRVGYTDEALWEIKHDGILNRLFFPRSLVKRAQGFESINSLFDLDWWRESFSDQSGIKGGELQENSNIILSNSHGIWFGFEHGDCMLHYMGGPPILYQILGRFIPLVGGFRSPLDSIGGYNVRSVSNMELGPSVLFVEGCGSGKIDSVHPENTISNTYLHSGVNAYISPTTYSAIGGYLEPRPKWPLLDEGVGLGIVGYLKAALNARRGSYPPVHFCGVIFEKSYQSLIEDNVDIGTALRNAKNEFLPEEADVTYLWTPPLDGSTDTPTYTMTAAGSGGDRVIVEKYCTIYQLNLLGDPAFNPYEPCNEGK